jgi:preprotein translocase subunit SecE
VTEDGTDYAPLQAPKRKERTSLRVFLREVRGELKRVAWPTRREVALYSIVVLVTVVLMTVYVFALDQGFGRLVLEIFQ